MKEWRRIACLGVALGIAWGALTFASASGGGGDSNSLYFVLDPVLVSNLSPKEDEDHLLQIKIEIQGKDPEGLEALKRHTPKIRDALIRLFSQQTSETMSSPATREEIRAKATKVVKKVLKKEGEKGEIEDLFFTNVIIE